MSRKLALLGVSLATLLIATPASAHSPPFPMPAEALAEAINNIDFDFRIQAQLAALKSTRLPSGHLGGIEIHGSATYWGLGAAGGLGFERLELPEDGSVERTLHGGYGLLAFQWRPVPLLDRELFRWIDPHIYVGGRLGAVGDADDADLRAAMLLGFGVDVGFAMVEEPHPVITIHYRFEPLRVPDEVAQHFILFGIGLRGAE